MATDSQQPGVVDGKTLILFPCSLLIERLVLRFWLTFCLLVDAVRNETNTAKGMNDALTASAPWRSSETSLSYGSFSSNLSRLRISLGYMKIKYSGWFIVV